MKRSLSKQFHWITLVLVFWEREGVFLAFKSRNYYKRWTISLQLTWKIFPSFSICKKCDSCYLNMLQDLYQGSNITISCPFIFFSAFLNHSRCASWQLNLVNMFMHIFEHFVILLKWLPSHFNYILGLCSPTEYQLFYLTCYLIKDGKLDVVELLTNIAGNLVQHILMLFLLKYLFMYFLLNHQNLLLISMCGS